jgi:hypothetical protein
LIPTSLFRQLQVFTIAIYFSFYRSVEAFLWYHDTLRGKSTATSPRSAGFATAFQGKHVPVEVEPITLATVDAANTEQ